MVNALVMNVIDLCHRCHTVIVNIPLSVVAFCIFG